MLRWHGNARRGATDEQATRGLPMTIGSAGLPSVYRWDGVPKERVAEGLERQMIHGPRLMVCRLRFDANVETPVHTHPHEQLTLVESGRVLCTVGDEQAVVGPGTVLLLPGGVRHGATSLDEGAVLIDVFTPPREDFLRPGPGSGYGADPEGRADSP